MKQPSTNDEKNKFVSKPHRVKCNVLVAARGNEPSSASRVIDQPELGLPRGGSCDCESQSVNFNSENLRF